MAISDYSPIRDTNAGIVPGNIRSNDFYTQQIVNSIRQLMADLAGAYAISEADIAAIEADITAIEADIVALQGANELTVLDYGAAANGTTVDNTAVTNMAADVGYVTFPAGAVCKLNTMTISVPIFFKNNAAITVASGQTITLQNRIVSPKQHIFQGVGTISLDGLVGQGEDSKVLLAAWFGVFPVDDGTVIQTTIIQRALNAFAFEGREGVLQFDNGSYTIDAAITVPRGVWIRGVGSRRTTFDLVNDNYTVFTCLGDACRFSEFQFEQPAANVFARDGILFDVDGHTGCMFDDIRMWNTRVGIKASGNQTTMSRIHSTYSNVVVDLAGSCLIWIQGVGCTVIDAKAAGTTAGPESVVLIGSGHTVNVADTMISNIRASEDTTPVRIVADTANVLATTIHGVVGTGDCPAIIDIETAGDNDVRSLAITNVVGNSTPDCIMRIVQASTGRTSDVTLDNAVVYGAGDGVVLTRTDGTLENITIGSGVNFFERTNGVVQTGTMTDISLPAHNIQGTWTPTLRFGGATTGITYSTQNGSYTKIGNIVFVKWQIILTSKGSATGVATVVTLPFSALLPFASAVRCATLTGLTGVPFCQAFSSTTLGLTQSSSSGTIGTNLTDAEFTNTTNIGGTFFYSI